MARHSEIEALRLDLARYGRRSLFREPSSYAVILYRLGRWNDSRSCSRLSRSVGKALYLVVYMWIRSTLNIEIPKEAQIAPGLRIFHQGPVVIHPDVVAGRNLVIRHGVTLGERRSGGGVPQIGDGVELGAYSQVLGPVFVGNGARIGASALVIRDVPEDGRVMAPLGTIVSAETSAL